MALLLQLGGGFFLFAYIAFAIAIARSAFQVQGKHWRLGVLLALILLTLPTWAQAIYWALKILL